MYQARGGVGVSAMRDTLSVMRANMFAPAGGASYGFTSLIAMNQPCSDLEASAWASAGVRAGFGFLMRARYWTRGLLFSSPSSAYERGSRCRAVTCALPSFRSPKTIAPVGQVCWQAVLISPSSIGRFTFLALIFTFWMRCTQNVHFSITPRERTVTSGLKTMAFTLPFGSSLGVNGVMPIVSML